MSLFNPTVKTKANPHIYAISPGKRKQALKDKEKILTTLKQDQRLETMSMTTGDQPGAILDSLLMKSPQKDTQEKPIMVMAVGRKQTRESALEAAHGFSLGGGVITAAPQELQTTQVIKPGKDNQPEDFHAE